MVHPFVCILVLPCVDATEYIQYFRTSWTVAYVDVEVMLSILITHRFIIMFVGLAMYKNYTTSSMCFKRTGACSIRGAEGYSR